MSYIDKLLHPGERVIHRTRVHWIIFAKPLLVMLVTLGAAGALAETQYSQLAALFFVIFVLPYAGSVALTYYFAEIAVTTQRLVARTGFQRSAVVEVLVEKIAGIEVEYGPLGRTLDQGTIDVHILGDTHTKISAVRDAQALEQAIEQRIPRQTARAR